MENKQKSQNEVHSEPLQQCIVGSWASSNLKDKVKYHLKMSVKAWHDWNEDLPNQVEVICNEVKRCRGQFLNVRRWLIIPPVSGFKECLVAEVDDDIQIHINHLVPAEF